MGRLEWNQKERDLGLNTHFNTYRMTLVKSINLSKILTPTKMEKVICALWFDMEVNTHAISPGNTISPPPFSHCFLIVTRILKVCAKNQEVKQGKDPRTQIIVEERKIT